MSLWLGVALLGMVLMVTLVRGLLNFRESYLRWTDYMRVIEENLGISASDIAYNDTLPILGRTLSLLRHSGTIRARLEGADTKKLNELLQKVRESEGTSVEVSPRYDREIL